MNIWRDISADRISPNDFIVCIEIEAGSKNKYELEELIIHPRLQSDYYKNHPNTVTVKDVRTAVIAFDAWISGKNAWLFNQSEQFNKSY